MIKLNQISHRNQRLFSSLAKKYACITGASSGIGLAYAEKLALLNYNLFLIQRKQATSKLLSSSSQQIRVLKRDLSNTYQLESTFKLILQQTNNKPPDLLINNAGNSVLAPLHFQSLSDIQKQVNLQIVSTTFLSSLYLKSVLQAIQRDSQYKQKKIFTIINTSSINAYTNPSFLSVYNSCKSYIKCFSQSLAKQINDLNYQKNIRVICTTPGPIRTKMMNGIDVQNQDLFLSPQTHVDNVFNQMQQRKGSFTTCGSSIHQAELQKYSTGEQSDINYIFKALKQKVIPFFQKRKKGIKNL